MCVDAASATPMAMQDLPLEVVYEDQHLIVLNKAAGFVVHPGPGNYSGTLVNALLHRFGMPAVRLEVGKGPEDPDLDDSGEWILCSSPNVSCSLCGGSAHVTCLLALQQRLMVPLQAVNVLLLGP